jgi:hypothetical protein
VLGIVLIGDGMGFKLEMVWRMESEIQLGFFVKVSIKRNNSAYILKSQQKMDFFSINPNKSA